MSEIKRFQSVIDPTLRVGRSICRLFVMRQLASHGDHDFNRGAAPALDQALYDEQETRMKTYWGPILREEIDLINNMNQMCFFDEDWDGTAK